MAGLSRKIDRSRKIIPRNVQVNILLTEEEVNKLDEDLIKRQEQNPGLRISRGSFVRDIVLKFLNTKLVEVSDEKPLEFNSHGEFDSVGESAE